MTSPAGVGAPAAVIVNADDWGASAHTTDCILDCILQGTVSSTSAMVFMVDSERGAELARTHDVDAGLHLNLTGSFSGPRVPARLRREQQNIAEFLRAHRYAAALFHPGLRSAFDYVVKAQLEEFERLFGSTPRRVDGHHHMHLCANVLLQGLLPAGSIARRNFSSLSGQAHGLSSYCRRLQDRLLLRRHRGTDYFFNLIPIERERLQRILRLAEAHDVEIEAHPARPAEYRFLMDGTFAQWLQEGRVLRGYRLKAEREVEPLRERREDSLPVRLRTGCAEVERGDRVPHICVCICTYKRPEPLKRLLRALDEQNTGGLFTYSVVVADNDEMRAGEAAVEAMGAEVAFPITYCVEPMRGIARARNKAVEQARGEYVALIDDDEFPSADWLRTLLITCREYGVDGVLGPVRRHFDEDPPAWLKRSRLYDRAVNPTGMQVDWRKARTGNVLLRRAVFEGNAEPFRPEFRAGEDQDFFRRKLEEGRMFVWCAEAPVFEVIPPARWRRSYYLRKALLQGVNAAQQPNCDAVSITKSVVAVPLYLCLLPMALIAGQHRFMTLLVKLCDHAGKLLYRMKINPIREEYVSE